MYVRKIYGICTCCNLTKKLASFDGYAVACSFRIEMFSRQIIKINYSYWLSIGSRVHSYNYLCWIDGRLSNWSTRVRWIAKALNKRKLPILWFIEFLSAIKSHMNEVYGRASMMLCCSHLQKINESDNAMTCL